MLYLTRKPGEAVLINDDIEVRVIEVRGRTVKLGFSYPQGATVLREELAGSLRDANREAIETVRSLPRPPEDLG